MVGADDSGNSSDVFRQAFTGTTALINEGLHPGAAYTCYVQSVDVGGQISEKKPFVTFMTCKWIGLVKALRRNYKQLRLMHSLNKNHF